MYIYIYIYVYTYIHTYLHLSLSLYIPKEIAVSRSPFQPLKAVAFSGEIYWEIYLPLVWGDFCFAVSLLTAQSCGLFCSVMLLARGSASELDLYGYFITNSPTIQQFKQLHYNNLASVLQVYYNNTTVLFTTLLLQLYYYNLAKDTPTLLQQPKH